MAVETEKEQVTCSKVSVELSSGIRKTAHLSKILNDLIIKTFITYFFILMPKQSNKKLKCFIFQKHSLKQMNFLT